MSCKAWICSVLRFPSGDGNGNQEVVIKGRRRAWFTLSAMIDRRRYSTTPTAFRSRPKGGNPQFNIRPKSRNRFIHIRQSIEDAETDYHRLGEIGEERRKEICKRFVSKKDKTPRC